MENLSRRQIVSNSFNGLVILLGARTASIGQSFHKNSVSAHKIIIETRILSKKHVSKRYEDPKEFWGEHAIPNSLQKLQKWVASSPVFSRRIGKAICPKSGAPVYLNEYSSYESYLAHMKLIGMLDPYKKTIIDSKTFKYATRSFTAIDKIKSIA